MQALDNFISPIPGFKGDIPIPAIPVSAQSPSDELASDPSVKASAECQGLEQENVKWLSI
jgi:hypothetical protein